MQVIFKTYGLRNVRLEAIDFIPGGAAKQGQIIPTDNRVESWHVVLQDHTMIGLPPRAGESNHLYHFSVGQAPAREP